MTTVPRDVRRRVDGDGHDAHGQMIPLEANTAILVSEARSLLAANQAARRLALVVTLAVLAATAVALATGARRVMSVEAPFCLLGVSFAFQIYAEVSVLGTARASLERSLTDHGGTGVFYERDIVPVRQRSPLVVSVRVLQAVTALFVTGAVVAGVVVAFEDSAALAAGTVVATALSLITAVLSYRDMLRSSEARVGAITGSGAPTEF